MSRRAELERRFLDLVATCDDDDLQVVLIGMDVVATMDVKSTREYQSALLGELSCRAPWALDALETFWTRSKRAA